MTIEMCSFELRSTAVQSVLNVPIVQGVSICNNIKIQIWATEQLKASWPLVVPLNFCIMLMYSINITPKNSNSSGSTCMKNLYIKMTYIINVQTFQGQEIRVKNLFCICYWWHVMTYAYTLSSFIFANRIFWNVACNDVLFSSFIKK